MFDPTHAASTMAERTAELMAEGGASASAHARVCACVMMNHPFPALLPLLRRIYAGRFSTIRFLIPFERLPDDDVITVYRGSYTHAGYLTDAAHALTQVDCDYYLVIHDDVLLNPRISDATFLDHFPIGRDDGFISDVGAITRDFAGWGWTMGMIPKLLYPKSQLFGSGIELGNLLRYLPSAESLRSAMTARGLSPCTSIRFDAGLPDDPHAAPSRVLLHGLSAHIDPSREEQQRVEAASREIERSLVRTMYEALQLPPYNWIVEGNAEVQLPLPLVTAGFATDFYILPKQGFADFCHYVGVASAANLFVEVMAPTVLYACCARVWTGNELGLDFSGFCEPKRLDWLCNPRAAAIHPVKLSALARLDQQDDLLAILGDIAQNRHVSAGRLAAFGFATLLGEDRLEGWHHREAWGIWAASHHAVIPVALDQPGPVRVKLVAPLDANVVTRMSGALTFNRGTGHAPFDLNFPDQVIDVTIERLEPDADGVGRIGLFSDLLKAPSEIHPGSQDMRKIGMGVLLVERLG